MTDPPPWCSGLDEALASLAPDGVRTGWRHIDPGDVARLHPEERRAISRALPSRQAEFATGRVLLRELIGTTDPIGIGPDRAPVLPPGIAASLAHDHEVAVAAVARAQHVALGIDVEDTAALEAAVAELILRPDERGLDPHLAFTLKEAAYKAWSRLGGRLLDHQEVRLDVSAASFAAEVIGSGIRLEGRYARAGERWVALVTARSTGT